MKSTWLSFALCCAMTSIGNVAAQERAPDFSVVTIDPILYQGQFNWDKALVAFSNDPDNPLGLSRTQRNALLWLQHKARVQRQNRLLEVANAGTEGHTEQVALTIQVELESFGEIREQVKEWLTGAQFKELETAGFRLVAAESGDLAELLDTVVRLAEDELVKEIPANQPDQFRRRVGAILEKLEQDIRDLKSRAAQEILES